MLLNSPFYLCSNFKHTIEPYSPLYHLKSAPKNIHLSSTKSFLFCETQNNKTFIKEFQIENQFLTTNNFYKQGKPNSAQQIHTKTFSDPDYEDPNKILIIDQIDGVFTNHAFTDDYALFLNRGGDFLLYNLLNKNIFTAEKQHPGLYSDAQVLTTQGYFLTCGGCVKNPINAQSQRIIKVWRINEDEDTLQLETRINTGHSRDIEASFLLNNKIVTLSSDKTLRLTNLSTQCIQRIITVNQDLFAACSLDYNTIIAGGIGKQLKIFDTRTGKTLMRSINIPRQLVQITKIIRFNEINLLLANINQLYTLDTRLMKLVSRAKTQGERISQLTVINRQQFVVGNRDKTLQIWRAL